MPNPNIKRILKQLALALSIFAVLTWLIFQWLSIYTHHGESIEVPDFKGLKIVDLKSFLQDKKLKYTIIDSIYDPKGPKGIVIRQDPEKKSLVKENRTIYLYVTTLLPPQVTMPKLKDKSLRQAISVLETYGLKFGRLTSRPDQCANCVLEQMVKGKKIEPGTQVPKGTAVDLLIGKGLSDEKVVVPNLRGLTYSQAIQKLALSSLSEGKAIFDSPVDSAHEKVYRQIPAGSGEKVKIRMGSSIDLFLTSKEELVDNADSSSVTTDPVKDPK